MSSTRCKECIVYHYWNHMGDQEKSFLNVVIGDYVAVPKKFANNIKGQIPEFVKLEVPDGKSYDIQIVKEHNELVFRSGWAKFASAYELEQCDMLVFKYSGSSRFRVQIFDQSGCEKEFSCVEINSNPSVKGSIVNGSCVHRMITSLQNTICKDCAAHHYWRQMDKRQFFVVMLDENFKSGLEVLLCWKCWLHNHQLETLNVPNFRQPNAPFGFRNKMAMDHPVAAQNLFHLFSLYNVIVASRMG